MVNKELQEYIQKAQALNFSDEQIKTELLNAGWLEADVEAGLNKYKKPNISIDYTRILLASLLLLFGIIPISVLRMIISDLVHDWPLFIFVVILFPSLLLVWLGLQLFVGKSEAVSSNSSNEDLEIRLSKSFKVLKMLITPIGAVIIFSILIVLFVIAIGMEQWVIVLIFQYVPYAILVSVLLKVTYLFEKTQLKLQRPIKKVSTSQVVIFSIIVVCLFLYYLDVAAEVQQRMTRAEKFHIWESSLKDEYMDINKDSTVKDSTTPAPILPKAASKQPVIQEVAQPNINTHLAFTYFTPASALRNTGEYNDISVKWSVSGGTNVTCIVSDDIGQPYKAEPTNSWSTALPVSFRKIKFTLSCTNDEKESVSKSVIFPSQ